MSHTPYEIILKTVATVFLLSEQLLGHLLGLIQLLLRDSAGLKQTVNFLMGIHALHLLHEPLEISHHVRLSVSA